MEEMKSEELRVFTVMERFLDKGLEKVEGEITFDVMIKQIRKAERELVKAKAAYEAEKAKAAYEAEKANSKHEAEKAGK